MRACTITPLSEIIRLKNTGAFSIYNRTIESLNLAKHEQRDSTFLTLGAMPLVEVTLNGVYHREDGTPHAYGVASYLLDSQPDAEIEGAFFNARVAVKASEPDMVMDLGWIRVGSLERDPNFPENEVSKKVHLIHEVDAEQFVRLTTPVRGHLKVVPKP